MIEKMLNHGEHGGHGEKKCCRSIPGKRNIETRDLGAFKKVKQSQRGFSLLEVLVAFSVLVLILGVILQIFSTGARSERLSVEYAEAAVIARSQLALLEGGEPLSDGIKKGQIDDRYSWEVEVGQSQVINPGSDVNYQRSYTPYDVSVTVRWQSAGKSRQVRIDTLRLANN